jgi:hypothetical protein
VSIGDSRPRQHPRDRHSRSRPAVPLRRGTWGPSPKPNALIKPATLAKQFVIRDRGRTNLGVPPGYLLILPTSEEVAASAG